MSDHAFVKARFFVSGTQIILTVADCSVVIPLDEIPHIRARLDEAETQASQNLIARETELTQLRKPSI